MPRKPMPVDQISKAAIRKRAQRAVQTNGETCSKCGCTTSLQRHHEDYLKPTEVSLLCSKCHRQEHLLPMATCKICSTSFQPRKSRNTTLCGDPACQQKLGQISAAKRWKTGSIGSDKSATASSPCKLQQQLCSFFDEPASDERQLYGRAA